MNNPDFKQFVQATIDNQKATQAEALKLAQTAGVQTERLHAMRFSKSGALVIAPDAISGSVGQELLARELILLRQHGAVTRGPAFFEALDPFLTINDIVNKIRENLDFFVDFRPDRFEPQYVELDYWKQSVLQLVNMILLQKRTFPSADLADLNIKNWLLQLDQVIALFYDLILFGKFDPELVRTAIENFRHFFLQQHAKLTGLHRDNYKLGECAQPLRILMTTSLIAHDYPLVTRIIGVPSGGTEAAAVLRYMYIRDDKVVPITFVPSASFHSRHELPNFKEVMLEQLSELNENDQIVIIDDNTATGTTLDTIQQVLSEIGYENVPAFVVEGDTIRTQLHLEENNNRVPNSSFLKYVSGRLAVLRASHSTGRYRTGSNAINELGRRTLGESYHLRACQTDSTVERCFWMTRENLTVMPTSRSYRQAKEEPLAVTEFRRTAFSNFAPVKVEWLGRQFPSVEHAYQCAKYASYLSLTLQQVADLGATIPMELSESMNWTLEKLFTDELVTAGTIKEFSQHCGLPVHMSQTEKVHCMIGLLLQKFNQPPFRDLLLATGNSQLIEGNTWNDLFWGADPKTYQGLNMLGRVLMAIRDDLTPHEVVN